MPIFLVLGVLQSTLPAQIADRVMVSAGATCCCRPVQWGLCRRGFPGLHPQRRCEFQRSDTRLLEGARQRGIISGVPVAALAAGADAAHLPALLRPGTKETTVAHGLSQNPNAHRCWKPSPLLDWQPWRDAWGWSDHRLTQRLRARTQVSPEAHGDNCTIARNCVAAIELSAELGDLHNWVEAHATWSAASCKATRALDAACFPENAC